MIAHSKKKLKVLITLIITIIVHLALDNIYRPAAYSQALYDFGIKDSFTQITAVVGISLLMVLFENEETWHGKTGRLVLIIVPVVAMLMYECIQPWLSVATFDVQDLLFTLIGGVFVAMIQIKLIK
jgi:hypothetical protein